MKHTDIAELLKRPDGYIDKTVTVCGWVRTARDSKSLSFVELNDGTSLQNLQLIVDKNAETAGDVKGAMVVGTSLCVKGKFVSSEKNGYELKTEEITVLGACPQDYPLQKKRHTLEFLRTIPHLRVRTRYFEALFTVRDQLAFAVHEYFHKNHYKYLHAPIIASRDCEGAGEMFRVTTQPWKTEDPTEEEYYRNDFFGKKAGLTVSCQLEGEMAAMGLGRIYTFGPTFRAEHSNTARHVAEFWQIEPEVSFADIDDIIEIAEEFVKYIVRYVLEHCQPELEFFDRWAEQGLIEKLKHVCESDFVRLDYTDAIEILKKSGRDFHFPVEWGVDLQTEHERFLTEEHFKKPVFVVNYPKDIKAFYMKQNPDGKTVAATDLLVPSVGEIIGCSEREADYDKLYKAMVDRKMAVESYAEYLDTRKYGSVPHSGFGLGFDRMLMYVTGVQNIRDALMFPRTVGTL